MQALLYIFPSVFMSSFSLTSLVCRHSDLTLVYIHVLRWQKFLPLNSLRIFFQHSKLLELASFSLLNAIISQGLGNQILFLFVYFWHNSPQWARASSFMCFSGRVISSSQRPLSDNTQHSQQTDIHAPGEIRIYNISRRAAADLRFRLRGRCDRLWLF